MHTHTHTHTLLSLSLSLSLPPPLSLSLSLSLMVSQDGVCGTTSPILGTPPLPPSPDTESEKEKVKEKEKEGENAENQNGEHGKKKRNETAQQSTERGECASLTSPGKKRHHRKKKRGTTGGLGLKRSQSAGAISGGKITMHGGGISPSVVPCGAFSLQGNVLPSSAFPSYPPPPSPTTPNIVPIAVLKEEKCSDGDENGKTKLKTSSSGDRFLDSPVPARKWGMSKRVSRESNYLRNDSSPMGSHRSNV